MNGLRKTINEIKELEFNLKKISTQDKKSFNEVASLLQTGAALTKNNRLIDLVSIVKRRAI